MINYQELVEQLVAGEIEEIIVEKENFFSFREVWLVQDEKERIVGEAGLEGRIVYRLSPKE
ncbi:hypothetical protein [Vagococcus sp.]|uniref:hypothetical protein n=1 Tax=Vagococcus sp. TaxID=1933889 RepID=UPI003F996154